MNPYDKVLRAVAEGTEGDIPDELKAEAHEYVANEYGMRKLQSDGAITVTKGPNDGPPVNVVYYVRFCCRIKIGTTTNLTNRLLSVPHDSLLATEPGGVSIERQRHYQFEQYSLGGEWFSMSPALVAHIRSIRSGLPDLKLRLISTADAMLYTGRDRHTLYRWATEGKLTKYSRGSSVAWDILELPAHNPVEARKLPPCDV